MNRINISNLFNNRNAMSSKDPLPKIKDTPSFSKVFNNEKSNIAYSNQGKLEEVTSNKHLEKDNNAQTVSNNQVDAHNNHTDKVSTKETKEVNSDEDIENQDPLEDADNELLDHIILLLQNLLTNVSTDTSDVENKIKVNCELSNIKIEDLVNLTDKLNLLLDESNVKVDQILKETIETTVSMLNNLIDKTSSANSDHVLLAEEDISKILNNLQDLKDSMGAALSDINSNRNSSALNIQVKNQKNLIDVQEENLLKDDRTLTVITDPNDIQRNNGEDDIKIKQLDESLLENHMENKDTVKQQELNKDLILNDNFSISQQEKIDQTIKVNVIKNQVLEPKQFISEIGQKASAFLSKDRNEMNIQLTPENLGKISIKIGLNDGTLTGKIYAENYSVKQIIEANLNQLRDALEENGLNIAGLEVNIGNSSQEFGNRMFQQSSMRKQKSNEGSIMINNGYITLEEDASQVNPYLISGKFDGLV